jgi:PPOX class probable FMN-dependent enzyme
MSEMKIETLEQLRTLYASPKERAIKKQLASLDRHCKRYISLSPFVVLSSMGGDEVLDASPRGGAPGFVKVMDDNTLLIPDSPGNNRLDTLENIIHTGRLGLLFLIPGVDETLRVNGAADLSVAPADIAQCTTEVRAPKLVIRVNVQQAYLHCAKAFMRSKLWESESRIERSQLPTMVDMINEQAAIEGVFETHEEIMQRYRNEL